MIFDPETNLFPKKTLLVGVTCPRQFNQVLSYDGVQVKPEMVCERESENLRFQNLRFQSFQNLPG
jgi:hypothetical protein